MSSWKIIVEDAGDGSGDLILPFPDDLLETAGWKEGDILEWIDNKDGSWILKKKDEHGTIDDTTK